MLEKGRENGAETGQADPAATSTETTTKNAVPTDAKPAVGQEDPTTTAASVSPAAAAAVGDAAPSGAVRVSIALEEGITAPPEPDLIEELKAITHYWFEWANVCIRLHWVVGLVGIVAATLAANDRFLPEWIAGFATTAAVCLAVTGLVNPQKRATKFLTAYRLLDPAIRAYRFNLLSKKRLLETQVQAEFILNDGEFDGK